MSDLERRYLRLVRVFYPAGYRDERGTEIVGTYLALSSPHRRWPSAADVTDLAGGGLQQRLRAVGATGIGSGLRLAAMLALVTATTLAGGWAGLELNPWTTAWWVPRQPATPPLSAGVWVGWLLAAAAYVVAPGRWTRRAIGLALVLTVAVVPITAAVDLARPPLFVLLAQVCLGLVALGVPGRQARWLRLLPLAGAAAGWGAAATFAYDGGEGTEVGYGWPANFILPGAAIVLLLVTLLVAVELAARNDLRGAWALVVLLGPVGMLGLHPLSEQVEISLYDRGGNATWTSLSTAAIIVVLAAVTVAAIALTAHRRSSLSRSSVERCGACGSLNSNSMKR